MRRGLTRVWAGTRPVGPRRPRARALCARVLALALSLFALASCGERGAAPSGSAQGPDAARMSENYEAPVAWLHSELVPEVGRGLVYRQIDDLEAFVADCRTPLVLGIIRYGHDTAVGAVSYLEGLADAQQDALAVVIARDDARDPFLSYFIPEGWPAFYLIREGRTEAKYFGISDELKKGIADLIKEGSR